MKYDSIRPGKVWLDTEGKRIHAHGGSVFFENGIFYFYGENKEKSVYGSGIWHYGVRMYSSCDLYNWKDEGIVLKPVLDKISPLNPNRIMDRPHIIYNKKTAKYVMYVKFAGTDAHPNDWDTSGFGICTADSLKGPYELIKVIYPNGYNAGDFDLAVDDETGEGYVIYEKPHTQLVTAKLTDDYLDVSNEHTSHFFNGTPPFIREAPAFFKRKGKLYLLTSGTTGYFPNPTESATADDYLGPWKSLGTTCVGDTKNNSFHAQFSSVFKHPYKEDLYIALGDRWLTDLPEDMPDIPKNFELLFSKDPDAKPFLSAEKMNALSKQDTSLADYVWLPITFDGDIPRIYWKEEWRTEDFK